MSCHHHCSAHAPSATPRAALAGVFALGGLAVLAALSGVHICADEVQMITSALAALQGAPPAFWARAIMQALL